MSSNLPPGVSEGDLPGNRPEDVAYERILDGPIGDWLAAHATAVAAADSAAFVTALQAALDRQVFCAMCETWLGDSEAVAQSAVVFYGRGSHLGMRYCSQGCREVDEAMGGP